MVIDLTMDSDSKDQTLNKSISTPSRQVLPVRSPALKLQKTPSKRKSDTSSGGSPDETPNKRVNSIPNGFARHLSFRRPSTASSRSAGTGNKTDFEIVVPTPAAEAEKEYERERSPSSDPEPLGVSQKYFPTDLFEKRAAKGAYPIMRKVDRSSAVLGMDALSLSPPRSTPAVTSELKVMLKRKLAGISGPKVIVAPGDELALAKATENFQFINQYQLRGNTSRVPEEFNAGCTCDGVCDPQTCGCVEGAVVPYKCSPDDRRFWVLSPEFMGTKAMIFECNRRCSCKGNCWNTVVQNSRTVRLEIFNTGNRGFGLRSPDLIRAGQFIDLYLGEVITEEVASTREEASNATDGHSYLFTLDFLVAEDPDWADDGTEGPFVVDGQKFGSSTRFMNHSCNPNCKIVPATRDHGEERIYDLAFFAVRDIPPKTELTFDYNPGWKGSKKADPNAVRCLCGEPNCRRQLWPNSRKGTA